MTGPERATLLNPRPLDSLQLVRAVAALMVVMFHVNALLGPLHGSPPEAGLFTAANSGVDLFFVLSGFIMVHIHAGDIGRPDRALAFYFKRAARLYPSAILLSLVALAGYAWGHDPGSAEKLTPTHIAASLLLLPQTVPPLLSVTWTLCYEVFFYLLFGLAILHRRIGLVAMLVWQVAALVILPAAPAYLPGWSAYIQPICLEFGMGMAAGMLVRHRARFDHPLLRLPAFLLGALLFFGTTLANDYDRGPLGLASVGTEGGGAALMILSLALWESAAPRRLWPPAIFLGDASYAIYLVHFPVIAVLGRLLIKAAVAPDEALCLAAAAIAVAGGCAFYLLFDRPTGRMLRRWGRARGLE